MTALGLKSYGGIPATLGAGGGQVTDGMFDELKHRLYSLQRTVQNVSKAAAEERKKEAEGLK